jgi:arylsulfatase A-like enzyme
MIENIDENMGRLIGKLEEWKLMENTMVIFMSDNGMTGGGSGRGKLGTSTDGKPMMLYNANMKGQKGSADEGGVRVPFFVRWDGVLAPERDVDRVAAHIDLFPTLADIAGVDKLPDGQVEGRSLVPLLKKPKAKWKDRYLFTQKARWGTGSEPNDHQWKGFAVRNQRYRLVDKALYDMGKDPNQTTDVAPQNPKVVKAMRAAYDKFWKEARPLMVNEKAPMSPTRPYHVLHAKQLKEGGIPNWQPPKL